MSLLASPDEPHVLRDERAIATAHVGYNRLSLLFTEKERCTQTPVDEPIATTESHRPRPA